MSYGFFKHANPAIIIGAAIAVLGLLPIIFFAKHAYRFEQVRPEHVVVESTFAKTTAQTFRLADINNALLEARDYSESVKNADHSIRDETKLTANLFLVCSTARRNPIGTATKAFDIDSLLGSLIAPLPLEQESEQVASFIGVPMQASHAVAFAQSIA